MSNFITNVITFKGDETRIKKLIARVKNDKYGLGSIDFNKVIPIPDNIYRGNLGPEEREKYGDANWYDWCNKNWGTKWNALGYIENPNSLKPDRLWCQTAWSPSIPITAELAKCFPDIEITHKYADEDFGAHVGTVVFKYGEIHTIITPKNFSQDAYVMAIEILDLSDEELKDMGYEYDASTGMCISVGDGDE